MWKKGIHAELWQALYAIFAYHINALVCMELNSLGHKMAIRDSLILHFVKPYILLWNFKMDAAS